MLMGVQLFYLNRVTDLVDLSNVNLINNWDESIQAN